jgi:hypothetical protein
MNIEQIANNTIPGAENKRVLKKAEGVTRDIIAEVLDCYQDSNDQLKDFAPHLKGSSLQQTCNNIWSFWKSKIKYLVDADGVQDIKTPAAVWATRYCDCKSFSVAVASTLHCLGIKGKFRFASYGSNSTMPTHVYVVALDGKKEIIIDCVWTGFNSQKPYRKKWDYNMTKVYRLSGTGDEQLFIHAINYAVGELNINPHDPRTTQAQMDLAIDLQRLELEQKYNRKKHAVGSLYDNDYQVEIEAHKAALGAIGLFKSKKKQLAIALKKNDGKGVNKKQAKLLAKAGIAIKKKKEGLLKKIGAGIKKIVTLPSRLAAKGALTKSAPFFLYLFVDPKVLAVAPEAVKVKRVKADMYRNQVINKMQMPAANFDALIRNGIMSSFGMPPEQVIAKWMADANFKVGIITEILSAAGGILKGLLGQFGEKLAADAEQFSPAPEDWGAVAASPNAAQMAQQQSSSYSPAVQPSGGTYNSDGATDDAGAEDTGDWQQTESGWVNRATGETSLNRPKELDNVTVTASKGVPNEAGGGGMILIALLGIGMLVMGGKK